MTLTGTWPKHEPTSSELIAGEQELPPTVGRVRDVADRSQSALRASSTIHRVGLASSSTIELVAGARSAAEVLAVFEQWAESDRS